MAERLCSHYPERGKVWGKGWKRRGVAVTVQWEEWGIVLGDFFWMINLSTKLLDILIWFDTCHKDLHIAFNGCLKWTNSSQKSPIEVYPSPDKSLHFLAQSGLVSGRGVVCVPHPNPPGSWGLNQAKTPTRWEATGWTLGSSKIIKTGALHNGELPLSLGYDCKKQPISFDYAVICEKLLAFRHFKIVSIRLSLSGDLQKEIWCWNQIVVWVFSGQSPLGSNLSSAVQGLR